jgi:hypothetical protein
MEGEDSPGRSAQRDPDPLPIRFLAHTAPELGQLGLQPLQDYCRGTLCRLDVEILGGRLEPRAHKLQEPLQPDAYCTADPPERDSLQQEAFNQRALFLGDHKIFWRKNKGPTT